MIAGLYVKLAVAAVIATALAGAGWKSYSAGKANVQASWDAEKLVQATAALAAIEAARTKEQELQSKVQEAQNAAKKREIKLASDAAGARRIVDGLQGELAAARLQMPGASCESVNRYAKTANTILGECTKEVERLAGTSAGIASDTQLILQAWPK